MLVLRSALYLAGAAVLVGKAVQRYLDRRGTTRPTEYAWKVADESPLYGEAPLPHPHADYHAARRAAEARLHGQLRAYYVAPKHAPGGRAATVAVQVSPAGKLEYPRLTYDPGHGAGKAALAAVQRLAAEGEAWRPAFREGLPVRYELFLHVPHR